MTESDYLETKRLWIEYKTNPTAHLQSVLAEKYAPIVHKIASGFIYKKPAVLDYDDLVSAGMLGLLDAIERYDPENEKKAQFQTYATFRVRGAILDEINKMDWTPRSVRNKIKGVIKSIEHHYSENNSEPTVNEIAEHSELDKTETREVLGQMERTYIVQMEHDVMDLVAPVDEGDEAELKSMVRTAMDRVLNPVEKHFVYLKFFMGYTNKEIQDTLDITSTELKTVREISTRKLMAELSGPTDNEEDPHSPHSY